MKWLRPYNNNRQLVNSNKAHKGRVCWTSLMMICITLMSLSGCQGKSPSEEASPLTVQKDLISVGFIQVGAESDWRIANTVSMQETFIEANGFSFEMVDAQQKTDKQILAIRDFIQKDVDYIVLAPNTESGWDTVLGEAKDAGIPVILVDRMIETKDTSLYVSWVGSNFKKEGNDAVTALETVLKEKGISDSEPLNIVTLQGTMGSSAQIGRTEGFAEKMATHPQWKMLDQQTGDFTQEKGQEVMTQFLNTYPDIDVVIAQNDNMAFGAINAIHKMGKTCGPDGDITIISFDGVKAAFEAMIAGEIDADIECNPIQGPRVVSIIHALEQGNPVEQIYYVEEGTWFAKDAAAWIDKRLY